MLITFFLFNSPLFASKYFCALLKLDITWLVAEEQALSNKLDPNKGINNSLSFIREWNKASKVKDQLIGLGKFDWTNY